MSQPPAHVLTQWSWPAPVTARPLHDGLINDTWLLRDAHGPVGILQRLNTAIFPPSIHADIHALTSHLRAKGMLTPELVPTTTGDLWFEDDTGVWRVQTHVGRRTMHAIDDPSQARAAATLVARFHAATSDLDWTFHHVRAGAHDTPAHMANLERALSEHPHHRLYEQVAPLAESVFAAWEALQPSLERPQPTRIIHGDLKISNVRFDGDEAVALVDLDTIARATLEEELGDAMRSWCNESTEDAPEPHFSLAIFEAALRGYAEGLAGQASPPSVDELASIVAGTERITLELTSRFATDALRETYFGWNPDAFASRGDHNLVRALGQYRLVCSFQAQRDEARGLVERILLQQRHTAGA